jgi:hypothetical protein
MAAWVANMGGLHVLLVLQVILFVFVHAHAHVLPQLLVHSQAHQGNLHEFVIAAAQVLLAG